MPVTNAMPRPDTKIIMTEVKTMTMSKALNWYFDVLDDRHLNVLHYRVRHPNVLHHGVWLRHKHFMNDWDMDGVGDRVSLRDDYCLGAMVTEPSTESSASSLSPTLTGGRQANEGQ